MRNDYISQQAPFVIKPVCTKTDFEDKIKEIKASGSLPINSQSGLFVAHSERDQGVVMKTQSIVRKLLLICTKVYTCTMF